MPWNWIHLDVRGAEWDILPTCGPGGMTRKEAHTCIQKRIDKRAALNSEWAKMSKAWQRGAEEDRVFTDAHTLAIYSYPEGTDTWTGARELVQDYVGRIHRYSGHTLPVLKPVVEGEKAPDPDPTEGDYGALHLTGWVGETPHGGWAPFLLFTSPDERAPHHMPLLAEVFGMNPETGSVTERPEVLRVRLDGHGWVTAVAGPGAEWPGQVTPEWEQLARDQGRVVVALSYTPAPASGDLSEYVDSLGQEGRPVVLAMVPTI